MALDSPGHGTPYLHTLDGRVDHREGIADDETHAYFTHLSAEPLRNGAVAVHYRCAR